VRPKGGAARGERHAERQTERQTGREPTCSIDLSWHEIAESRSGQRCRPWNPEARTTRQVRHELLPHGPISRLRHGSPDVGSAFGRTGIAGEIVVFEGTFDPVVAHAVRESSDTERDVRRSRAVGIFSRGPEPLQRQEPPSPSGRKRSLLPAHLSLLLLFLMQFGDLFVKSFSLRVLQPGMAGEPNEREEAVRFTVFGFAIGEAGKPAESTPVGGARIGVIAPRQRLRPKCLATSGASLNA